MTMNLPLYECKEIKKYVTDIIFDMLDLGRHADDISFDSLCPSDVFYLCGLIIKYIDTDLECITENNNLDELRVVIARLMQNRTITVIDDCVDVLENSIVNYYHDTINEFITFLIPEVLTEYEDNLKESANA